MKLIIVSNRVAHDMTPQAGGLTSAMQAALESIEGTWIGWSGEISETTQRKTGRLGRFDYAVFSMTAQEHQSYYLEFSNEVLWPACHLRPTYLRLLDNAYKTYTSVNRKFAQEVAAHADAEDTIWVHDYHLLLVAKHLRALGHAGAVGYFHHIPIPPLELLHTIPHHAQLLTALLHYDLIGLQTSNDLNNLRLYFEHLQSQDPSCQMQIDTPSDTECWISYEGRRTKIGVYPISIYTQKIELLAAQSAQHAARGEWKDLPQNRPLMVGVDRLDYTKGLELKLQAFEKYLQRTHTTPPASLVQIAPLTRSEVPHYQQLCTQVLSLVEHIRNQYGAPHYEPLHFSHDVRDIGALTGLYRMARAALVTPTKDGMNLVAKEFIASQNPRDPGVLILSEFAGAANELKEALIVNPFDVQHMAQTMAYALEMPLQERIERHGAMLKHLRNNDIHRWYEHFLQDLAVSGMSGMSARLAPTSS